MNPSINQSNNHQSTQQQAYTQKQCHNRILMASQKLQKSYEEIQLQNMSEMNRFDIHQIYGTFDSAAQNKHRSHFIFLLPIIKRGNRHLIAIDKKQLICTAVKVILLLALCYYLHNWVSEMEKVYHQIKTAFLWSFRILPFLFLIESFVDPGFVLDHEIYEQEYEATNDGKRPKNGKYCDHCRIFVDRKTGHCFTCNHCVRRFDHHCGIMGKCVGATNAIVFYTFVILVNVVYMGMVLLTFYHYVFAN